MQILLTEHGINATVTISRRFDVPFLAGASNDGRTVYIDRRVPRKLAVKRKGGRGYVSIAPDQFLATHETVEHRLMVHQKMPYLKAHAIATHAEKAAVERAGADWDNYEKVMDGLLAHIEHEKPRRAPPDLYLKPYPHDKKVLLKKLAVRSRAEGGPLEADPNMPDQDNPWESVPRDASGRPVIYIGGAPDPKQTAPGSSTVPGQVEEAAVIDKNPQFAQPPSPPGPGASQNIQPDQAVPRPGPPSPVNGPGGGPAVAPSSDAGAASASVPSPAPPVPGPHKPTPDEIYAWEHGEAAPAPPQPPAEHTRSILDKLLGLGGLRYQLFPERIVRSALSAPGEALWTGQLTQRDPYGRVTGVEPEMSVGPTSTDVAAHPPGFPSETAIQRSQDVAALQFSPGAAAEPVVTAATEAGKPGAAIAAAEHTPFYSAVEQAIPKAPQAKMTADQWTGWLKNQPGVKAEELEWSGLGDLPKGPITKDQLLTHLKENQVQPQLVEKSGEPPMSEDEQVEAVRNKMEEEFARQYPFSTADDFRDYMDTDEGFEKYHELLAELPEQMERQPKYSGYQMPGGSNYRETLLTLPSDRQIDPATIHEQLAQLEMEFQKLDPNDPMSVPRRRELRAKVNILETQLNSPQTAFQSSHWEEPNVLLHLRMNDRVIDAEPIANIEAKVQAAMPNAKYAASGTPDQLVKRGVLTPQEAADWSRVHNFQSGYENQPGTGLKTLHLEELQSDWHQKGRKQGYDDPIAREAAEKKLEAAGYPISNEDAQAAFREGIINREDVDAIRRNYIPNAPFKTTWPDLGLKTAITKAAREGYDSISWTPGEKQAERYDLSKHVDAIRYAKNPADGTYTLAAEKGDQFHPIGNDIPESKLEDYLGKDVAERVIKGMGDETNGVKLLSGLDLKVGGEGMKGFYDKMLVDKANALGKKFGAKVEYKNVPIGLNPDNYILSRHGTGWVLVEKSTGDRMNPIFSSGGQAEEWLKKQNNSIKVPVLRLTPQLKEQALKGMPLFTEAGKPGAAIAAAEHSLDPNAIDRQLARNPGASIFDVGGRPDLNPPVAAPTILKGAGSPLGIRSPQLRQLFDRTIGPYMPEQEFANKYLMGVADPESTVIEPSEHFDGAGIAVTSSLVDPKTNTHLGSIERHIVPGEAAYHAALEINPKAPSGFTKQLLQNQIDLYNKMGVRYVDLYANISVGGYAWAKYGWVPEANAWDSIRSARPGTILGRLHRIGKVVEENPEVGKQIPPQVLRAIPKIAANPDPRSIWDIADINTPIPRELVPGSPRGDMYATYTHPSTKTIGQYLLKGMGWDGRLNLFDPESMERFNGYIGRGGAGQTLKSEAGKPAMALAASKGPWKTEGNNVLAYHGTTAEGAAGIEQEGLKVNAGNRRYPGHSLYRGDRGHSVFLSPDPLEAAEWGPHVYEARIPKDDKLFKHNPDDPFDTEGRYRGDIPRNWLKKWEKP